MPNFRLKQLLFLAEALEILWSSGHFLWITPLVFHSDVMLPQLKKQFVAFFFSDLTQNNRQQVIDPSKMQRKSNCNILFAVINMNGLIFEFVKYAARYSFYVLKVDLNYLPAERKVRTDHFLFIDLNFVREELIEPEIVTVHEINQQNIDKSRNDTKRADSQSHNGNEKIHQQNKRHRNVCITVNQSWNQWICKSIHRRSFL
jgi:hypothetical protein